MTKKDSIQKISIEKLRFMGGLFLCVFAFFVFFGCLSYLFSWKQDQSLTDASGIFAEHLRVANAAGESGFKLSRFLMADAFGLASFALVAVLFVAGFKMMFSRKVDWLRAAIVGLAGTFSLSLLLSFVSVSGHAFGWDSAFGSGLGGSAGLFLVQAMQYLFGNVVTLILILAMCFCCVYLSVDMQVRKKPAAEPDTETAEESDEAYVETAESHEAAQAYTETAVETDEAVETVETDETDDGEETAPFSSRESAVSEKFTADDEENGYTDDTLVDISGPDETLSTDIDEELPQLDIRSDVDRYEFPSLDLLEDYADKRYTIPDDEIQRNVAKIKSTLESFKIHLEKISASVGYTVTLYKITLGEGVRVNSVRNLEDDIAIKIGIKGVRVVMLSDALGIEVPNDRPSVVPLKAILNSDAFRNTKAELPIGLGYTITTKAKVFDLADAPHLLVAGATKQGKSVGLTAIITSLLYAKHPTELKFVFVDPKMVEFQKYSKLYKHYLAALPCASDDADEADQAIVKDAKNADAVLRSLCIEMDERYKLLAAAGVNKVTNYNEKFRNRHLLPTEGHHFMPYIVIVVDEYADLTKASFGTDKNISRSIENSINRLAAKGRAAGLHIIIATQRPSVDVITGTIKGNFPTRIAFRTVQRQDSQTILGIPGAERLIGKGDMLFFANAEAERVQCALVDSDEVDRITDHVASQIGYKQSCGGPYYLPEPGDAEGGEDGSTSGGLVDMSKLDELFEEAAKLAVVNQNISTSMIQRKMQLGFARAGRIMDQLEAAGVVGPQQGSKPREALIPDLATLQEVLNHFVK